MTTRWRLTRAGVGALVIAALMLAAGVMKTINLLILLGVLLVALVLLNAWTAWRSVRKARPVQGPQCDHFAGQRSARVLGLRADGDTCAVAVSETSTAHACSAFTARMTHGDVLTFRVPFDAARRGAFPTTSAVESGYPFGFVVTRRVRFDHPPLVVFPELGTVAPDRLRRWLLLAGAGEARRRPLLRPASLHADLRSVRSYRSGDSRRHIHWRSTARRGELMVRDYDSPDALDLVLAVDPWLPLRPTREDRRRAEGVLSLAATLIQSWCDGNGAPRVVLAVAGSDVIVEGRASPSLARLLFHRLARIELADDGAFEWPALPASTSRMIRLLLTNREAAANYAKKLGPGWQGASPKLARAWYHPPEARG